MEAQVSEVRSSGEPEGESNRTPPHFLHIFPTFAHGGVSIRIANIINHFGNKYRHTILALDGRCDARSRLRDSIDARLICEPWPKTALPRTIARCRARIREIRPDLLITYNWGATEWGLANAIGRLCPHVHMESGFGPEEADRQLPRRVLFRRLALSRTRRIVVPSQTLVTLATTVWKFPPEKIAYIPNGVDCDRFAVPPQPVIEGFRKRPGELIVGTVAPLRAEKNLGRLVRSFARAADGADWRLVIVGDGPERSALEALADRLGLTGRVLFAGHIDGIEQVLGWFDVFAISSDTEQMPNSVVQAMAAGRPVVGTDVGDVAAILAPANRRFVVPRNDEAGFAACLATLLGDPEARASLGQANQAHARAHYGQERMFRAYEAVFAA